MGISKTGNTIGYTEDIRRYGIPGKCGTSGPSGVPGISGTLSLPISGKPVKPSDEVKKYSDYIFENLDKSEDYYKYIAENLDKSESYSEYIAKNLKNALSYSEYLKEIGENTTSYTDYLSEILEPKNTIMSLSKYKSEDVLYVAKTKNDMTKIYDLYFDNEILSFLKYDDLETFIKNVESLMTIGYGVDGSTIFQIFNSEESMIISYKTNVFHKYNNKILPLHKSIDKNESDRRISEIELKIKEKEIELSDLKNEDEIIIDNNTLELIGEYNEKIKNYYDKVMTNVNNLEIEKSNLETLMNAEILEI